MGKERAEVGHLDRRGLLPLLESAYRSSWSGVIRLRNGHMIGAVWMVKGHVVHALRLQDGAQTEGTSALESIAAWREGAYFLDGDALPPARSIRLRMDDVLAALRRSAGSAREEPEQSGPGTSQRVLGEVLRSLRRRVPGLESLSLSRGSAVEVTTAADSEERDWLNGQIRRYCDDNVTASGKLLVQDGDHALLIVKKGRLAAVLAARGSTAPEALWRAGEEAEKEVWQQCDNLPSAGDP